MSSSARYRRLRRVDQLTPLPLLVMRLTSTRLVSERTSASLGAGSQRSKLGASRQIN
ncbi:hypothetical protein [Thermogemmatispora sp.]|uniref:hypothetical protein n=1 Tax=Thermogemmatispora sp. TaxID=1968838 RepID=UPI00257FD204|nr:hypothetical protein [Thermogemmatispora sp.]